MSDIETLDSFFLDCQCAIFLVDITSQDSFYLVKQILNIITNNLNYNCLNKLLLINKVDLEEKRKISSDELKEYINEFSNEFEKIEISIRTKKNLEFLWEKVNECVNKNNKNSEILPINLFSEKYESNGKELLNAESSVNIILIGDSGVGKTNLFSRYFQNLFENNYISTVGMDRQTKLIKYKDKFIKLIIFDTAGQERYRSIPTRYYQNADGALLLFDVTMKKSFENINIWLENIKKNSRVNIKQTVYLIGNKIDLFNRAISKKEAKEYANNIGLKYYEMSGKININIYEIISRLFFDCINNISEIENGFEIKKNLKKKNVKRECC